MRLVVHSFSGQEVGRRCVCQPIAVCVCESRVQREKVTHTLTLFQVIGSSACIQVPVHVSDKRESLSAVTDPDSRPQSRVQYHVLVCCFLFPCSRRPSAVRSVTDRPAESRREVPVVTSVSEPVVSFARSTTCCTATNRLSHSQSGLSLAPVVVLVVDVVVIRFVHSVPGSASRSSHGSGSTSRRYRPVRPFESGGASAESAAGFSTASKRRTSAAVASGVSHRHRVSHCHPHSHPLFEQRQTIC